MSTGGTTLKNWFAELRRRKVFRVATVYMVVAWLLVQVAGTTFGPLGLPGWTMKLVILLAAFGFPLACGLAWAFDVTPRGIERTATGAEVPPPAAEFPVSAQPPAKAAPGPSVAILPFLDMSPAHDQEYFCDGIAEEIINALCCVRGLRIASRTSSFQFKGRSADVREIGKALGVDAVLEGSVRKAGERVRVTAQLVGATDGYHVWSESFDRNLEDVFAIQTEIAQRLVKALRVSLTPQENALLERGGTRNAEAYDLYLRGQQLLRNFSSGTLVPAAAMFRQAIAQDGEFAQAHAGLANALATMRLWRIEMTAGEIAEAFTASERALALEPRMPEAFVARGCLMSMQGRAEDAARDFEEAIRLNPASSDAHYMYARHCFAAGQFEKAAEFYRAALRLEPDSYQMLAMLGTVLERLGRHEEVTQVRKQSLQEIERHLRTNPGDGRALYLGSVAAAQLGDPARATELAELALAASPDDLSTAYNIACAFAVMGNRGRALELLDHAVQEGRGSLAWIERDPDLDSLRGDPRFEAIVQRLRAATARATA